MKRFLFLVLLLPFLVFSKTKDKKIFSEEFSPVKKYTFFAELNYVSNINNDTQSADSDEIKSASVPYIPIPYYLKWYSIFSETSYTELAQSSTENLYRVFNLITPQFNSEDERSLLINNALNIIEFSKVSSETEMKDFLSTNIKSSSFGEKTAFLANILSLFSDNYDFDSLKEDSQEVKISDMDMIRALNGSIQTGTIIPVGVCRHMHQFAIRIAKSIGIDNAFGVGFRTHGGGHRTLVLGVPGSPTQVVQLNYGEKVDIGNVTGTAALTQNHSLPSTGIRFRIYNGEDKASITLPTEQGALLNLLSGGRNSDLVHGIETESIIQQFGIKTPYGTFRAFKANSPERGYSNFQGVGYDFTFDFFKYFSNEFGFAGFQNERSLLDDNKLKTEGLYLRNTLNFKWEFYTSKNLNISAFTSLHFRGSFYCSTLKEESCISNSDFNIDGHSGVQIEYYFPNGSLKSSVSAHGQLVDNHASFATHQKLIIPAITNTNKLSLTLTDDLTSEHEFSTTHYDLGTSTYNVFSTTNTIFSREYEVDLYHSYDAPIGNNTPAWLPGGAKVMTYGAKKLFLSKLLEVNISYQSREYELEKFFGVNIKLIY